MTLPNFLIIGANRSGTTSLHRYLGAHPQVFLPRIKEPHFFMVDGIEIPPDRPDARTMARMVHTYDEYQALFDSAAGKDAIGEASTGYLCHPNAPLRIHARLPNVKLIAILRNPVERA